MSLIATAVIKKDNKTIGYKIKDTNTGIENEVTLRSVAFNLATGMRIENLELRSNDIHINGIVSGRSVKNGIEYVSIGSVVANNKINIREKLLIREDGRYIQVFSSAAVNKKIKSKYDNTGYEPLLNKKIVSTYHIMDLSTYDIVKVERGYDSLGNRVISSNIEPDKTIDVINGEYTTYAICRDTTSDDIAYKVISKIAGSKYEIKQMSLGDIIVMNKYGLSNIQIDVMNSENDYIVRSLVDVYSYNKNDLDNYIKEFEDRKYSKEIKKSILGIETGRDFDINATGTLITYKSKSLDIRIPERVNRVSERAFSGFYSNTEFNLTVYGKVKFDAGTFRNLIINNLISDNVDTVKSVINSTHTINGIDVSKFSKEDILKIIGYSAIKICKEYSNIPTISLGTLNGYVLDKEETRLVINEVLKYLRKTYKNISRENERYRIVKVQKALRHILNMEYIDTLILNEYISY